MWPGRGPVGASVSVVGLAAGLFVAGWASAGTPSAKVALHSGAAWFVTPEVGEVTLLDGSSGMRIDHVPLGTPGADLVMVQAGESGLLIDRGAGTMTRIASDTFRPGPSIAVAIPGDDSVEVVADERSAWVVSQSATVVREYDPRTGRPTGPALAGPGGAVDSALAADGTLWIVALESGSIRSFRSGREASRHQLGSTAGGIAIVGDTPVVVDAASAELVRIDPRSGKPAGRSCFEVSVDADLFAGSEVSGGWVAAVVPAEANVAVANPGSGACRRLPLRAPTATDAVDRYGAPVVRNGRVFVPDHQAGVVLVVDIDGVDSAGGGIAVPLGADIVGHPFTVFEHHGYVWFDDPTSGLAGVIHDDLVALVIDKVAGDNRPHTPTETEPTQETPRTPICSATPDPVQVSAPVRLNAVLGDLSLVVRRWSWRADGLATNPTDGPQSAAVWTVPGVYAITVEVSLADGTTRTGACQVTVVALPDSVTTTTQTTATSNPVGVTTTVDSTSTSQPAGGGTTTTQPGPTSVTTTTIEVPEPPVTDPATTTTTAATTTTTSEATTTTTTQASVEVVPEFDWSEPAIVGIPVTFRDTSTGQPDAWQWDFAEADVDRSVAQHPTATWSRAGSFQVVLTASRGGSGRSVTHTVVVSDPAEPPGITSVTLDPPVFSTPLVCPTPVDMAFAGSISARGPLTVQIEYARSDGTTSAAESMQIPEGVQTLPITHPWTTTATPWDEFWATAVIRDANGQELGSSNRATAELSCANAVTVDSVDDAVDADPGDGTCADAAGACTLRAAITEVAASDPLTIVVVPAGTYVLQLPTTEQYSRDPSMGDIDVDLGGRETLTIHGAGRDTTIVDGGGLDRILDVHGVQAGSEQMTLIIEGITLRNGAPTTEGGGAMRITAGTTVLRDSAVSDNAVAASGNGGGILVNGAALTVESSIISGNTASSATIGGYEGGGLYSDYAGVIRILDSRFEANAARSGGGAELGGEVSIERTTFSGNTASEYGGGLSLRSVAVLDDVDITDNSSGEHGGGLFAAYDVTVRNSRIVGNRAGTGPLRLDRPVHGGGVSNNNTLTLEATTVTGNMSVYENSSFSVTPGAGGLLTFGSTAITTLRDVVFDNAAAECQWGPGVSTHVLEGTNSFPPGDVTCGP